MSKGRIKILHVLDSLGIGGMERVVIDVVNGLAESSFDQTVCCISRRGEAAQFLRAGARCIDLGKGAEADHLTPFKLARVIRAEQPDVIHTQSWSGVDTAIAQRLTRLILIKPGPRLVQSEHGRNFPHIDGEPWKRRLARRFLYHAADRVFAISDEVRSYYCRETGFPVERMQVIPNGVDPRRIDQIDQSEANTARGELGIAADDFVIGTVARLDRTKDTMTLARAFSRLSQTAAEPVKLLIVGDGDQRPALETFATEQGLKEAVIFTGLRHDVPRLLGVMDVFALTSLSEGLPITVLEAMCASLPIVATKVGALPELVEEGVTGFLVDPKDAAAVAGRLTWFYHHRDLGRSFGEAGRRKVEREFSLDLMLQRYADLYRSVSRK